MHWSAALSSLSGVFSCSAHRSCCPSRASPRSLSPRSPLVCRPSPSSQSARSSRSCRARAPVLWLASRSCSAVGAVSPSARAGMCRYKTLIDLASRHRTASVPGAPMPMRCFCSRDRLAGHDLSLPTASRESVCNAARTLVSIPPPRIGAMEPACPSHLPARSICSASRAGECRGSCCRPRPTRPRPRTSCASESTCTSAADRASSRRCVMAAGQRDRGLDARGQACRSACPERFAGS